jgi:2-methylcitrate dehydratase PrpD
VILTVALAKRSIIDALGGVLAGSTTRGRAVVHEYVRAGDESSEAAAFALAPFGAGAASAALANGASGHAIDFDGTQLVHSHHHRDSGGPASWSLLDPLARLPGKLSPGREPSARRQPS